MSNSGDAAKLAIRYLAHATNVLGHRHSRVKPNTDITDVRCRGYNAATHIDNDVHGSMRVIPCQINRWFPLTPSDSFEIWHTCRDCLETNNSNIRQIFFNLGQASSEIWACEKMKK